MGRHCRWQIQDCVKTKDSEPLPPPDPQQIVPETYEMSDPYCVKLYFPSHLYVNNLWLLHVFAIQIWP